MKKSAKIIIVGAGPVGCYLGQLLKQQGFNPLILEEHKEVGRPVQCAGIVGKNVFEDTQLPISKKSILNCINGAKLSFAEDSFNLERPKVAYIIDRAVFDKELSNALDIRLETEFKDANVMGEKIIVKTNKGDFSADILVGADGPNSQMRKVFQFSHNIKLYKGLQYRIISKEEIKLKDKVKVEYLKPFSLFTWMIPEGGNIIRIGSISDRPIQEIENFILKHKIQGEIIEKNAGPIPVGLCDLIKNNIALVGDAACQIKPLTSGGIFYGLKSAELLASAIKSGDLTSYEKRWNEEFGQEIKLCLLARFVMENMEDGILSKVFSYVKDNARMLERIGDFENHSSAVWSLAMNPRTYATLGSMAWGVIKRPRLWVKLLKRK